METVYALVASLGLPAVAASAYLTTLAVPIQTAAVMLAAGAVAALPRPPPAAPRI